MRRCTAYIGLGSNIGRRPSNLKKAIRMLARTAGISVEKISPFYETSPVGPEQRDFINAAVRITTGLAPLDLLKTIKDIEKIMGRRRQKRWGPRLIDLDILLYGDLVLKKRELTLPHPAMAGRLFVLVPLAVIAPKAVHPALGKTITRLMREFPLTPGKQKIKMFKS